jgi:hypothetical protein
MMYGELFRLIWPSSVFSPMIRNTWPRWGTPSVDDAAARTEPAAHDDIIISGPSVTRSSVRRMRMWRPP